MNEDNEVKEKAISQLRLKFATYEVEVRNAFVDKQVPKSQADHIDKACEAVKEAARQVEKISKEQKKFYQSSKIGKEAHVVNEDIKKYKSGI